ncbi:cytochrome P450 [Astrocystis sublimbata]|nr:cytochrome P450 [Astrocystis sublimbata]
MMTFPTTSDIMEGLSWTQSMLAVVALTSLWYTASSAVAWYKLRHIPGPLMASFSNIWAFKTVWTGKSHEILTATQRKYGSVWRIGPDAIVVSDYEAWNPIVSARSQYKRGIWFESLRFDYRGASIITELDLNKHNKRKSKLMTAFTGKNVFIIEKKIDKWLTAMVNAIRTHIENGRETMDIGKIIQYMQVDLVTELGMGRAWNDLAEDKDQYGYLSMTEWLLPSLQSLCHLPLWRMLYGWTWLVKQVAPKTTDRDGLGFFLGILESETKNRFNDSTLKTRAPNDMMDMWIQQGLPEMECQLDLSLLLPAGTETVAMMARGTLLHLMNSPAIYQRTKQEIREAIAAGRISSPITNEEALSLEYMQAVIREGLRIMCPVNFGFSKEVPAGGDTICGTYVPGGTAVFLNYHAMMRNKQSFGEDADTFRPERFLGSGPEVSHMIKTVDLSFGNGRFVCLGKVMAVQEMNKLFVELFRNFDFQSVNPEKPWSREGYGTWIVNDFWARVTEDKTMSGVKG